MVRKDFSKYSITIVCCLLTGKKAGLLLSLFLQDIQFITLLCAASVFGVHCEAVQGGPLFDVKGDLGSKDNASFALSTSIVGKKIGFDKNKVVPIDKKRASEGSQDRAVELVIRCIPLQRKLQFSFSR